MASAIYALMPVLVFFFPEFDQAYPVLSMLLVILWSRTLATVDSKTWANSPILFGTVLFLASFFVYQILAIGVFIVFQAGYWMWQEGWRASAALKLLRSSGVALAVCAAIYAVLWATTGYNASGSFLHSMHINQYYLGVAIPAPYIIYNLYVFAMGLGMIAVPMVFLHAGRVFDHCQYDPMDIPLTLMAIASVIVIDLTNLFAGETDREWLFLVPIIAVPAAIELARLPWKWRLAIFGMQGWILMCMRAKIAFIEP